MQDEKTYNVLFLCTGNSARSILGEALLNHLGKGRFRAWSAGSHPAGKVNPFALELLEKNGLAVDDLRSKNWDEFSQAGANEVCPVWPGHPMTAHWGIEDPAAVEGSDEDKRKAFVHAYNQLSRRILLFTSLPLKSLNAMSIKDKLVEIGKLRERGE